MSRISKVYVNNVSPFNKDKGKDLLVEAHITSAHTSGMLWWRKHWEETKTVLFMTVYGHVWFHYPSGDKVGLDLTRMLDESLHEHNMREIIDEELES